MDYLSHLTSTAVDLCLIFGPTSAYYFQYKLIRKTRSLGSFSVDICGILIFASLLRIFFRFGKLFKNALLFQAITMLIVQILLLKECIKVKPVKLNAPLAKLDLTDGIQFREFWRWDDFGSYMKCVGGVTIILAALTFMFTHNMLYVETVGGLSALVESSLGIPQFLSNWKNKSTKGLSIGMIMVWFAGDLAKTLYFVINGEPVQFILCGSTQIIIDMCILMQIYMYAPKGYQEIAKSNSRADNSPGQNKPVHRKLIADPESMTEITMDATEI